VAPTDSNRRFLRPSLRNRFKWLLLLASLSGAGSCQPLRDVSRPVEPVAGTDPSNIRPQVEAVCGGCHSPPPAGSFPKDAWPFEVSRGFDFYFESFRQDLRPPSKAAVIAYYQSHVGSL
jgi:hypothetical protein